MNTRTFTKTEVQIFVLVLNTFGRAEDVEVVAMSDDYERLVKWYKDQLAEEPYREDGWYKVFKKGSPIEYNNPCSSLELNILDCYKCGIHDEWIDINNIANIRNHYRFV